MKKLMLVAVLAACGGSKAEPVTPSNSAGSGSAADDGAAAYHQKVLADMTAFRDRMCKCTDKPCAQSVMTDFNTWGEQMTKNPAADSAPPDGLQPKLTEANDGYYECQHKVMDDQ
jgi:hypothetical protein